MQNSRFRFDFGQKFKFLVTTSLIAWALKIVVINIKIKFGTDFDRQRRLETC